jgi:hypothetical protein
MAMTSNGISRPACSGEMEDVDGPDKPGHGDVANHHSVRLL